MNKYDFSRLCPYKKSCPLNNNSYKNCAEDACLEYIEVQQRETGRSLEKELEGTKK